MRRKMLGPYSAVHAQRFVSTMRVMRRQLLMGNEPSFDCCPALRKSYPGDFVQRRKNERLRRAINRGESHRSLTLRGFW